MRIKAAAIRYRLKSEPDMDKVVWGPYHYSCRDWFMLADIYPSMRILDLEEEGFLTDTGKFVDRYRAYEIAKEAGQLKYEDASKRLISENCIFAANK